MPVLVVEVRSNIVAEDLEAPLSEVELSAIEAATNNCESQATSLLEKRNCISDASFSADALLNGGTAPSVYGDDDETKLSSARGAAVRAQLEQERRLVVDLTAIGNALLAHRAPWRAAYASGLPFRASFESTASCLPTRHPVSQDYWPPPAGSF